MLYTVLSSPSLGEWNGILRLVLLFVLSVLLVRKGYFRLNWIFLALLTVYTVAAAFLGAVEPFISVNALVLLLLCCFVYYYRAKWERREARVRPETFRIIEGVLAVAMTALAILSWQKISVFAGLQTEACGLAAVYLWLGVFFDHRRETFR